MKNAYWPLFVVFAFILFSCSEEAPPSPVIDPPDTGITIPPAALGLDPFYLKYIDAAGIPVISSEKVSDEALLQVKEMALFLFGQVPEARQQYIQNNGRIGIMSEEEVTTDIPEHRDLNERFPGTDWDVRARGLGATLERPITTCAEENVLCYDNDGFWKEDIFVHEMAHGIHVLGLRFVDPEFDKKLQQLYDLAQSEGRWINTYANTNPQEYFAEGVQSYFGVNAEAIPTNGIHNQVNTPEELAKYDPELFDFIKGYFPNEAPVPSCH